MTYDDYVANIPTYVQTGAAVLDQQRPGWARDIAAQIECFDIKSCAHCVLGLLYGDYSDGVNVLRAQGLCLPSVYPAVYVTPYEYGFDIPYDRVGGTVLRFDLDEIRAYYKALGDEWVRVIGERVSAAAKLVDEPVLLPVAK